MLSCMVVVNLVCEIRSFQNAGSRSLKTLGGRRNVHMSFSVSETGNVDSNRDFSARTVMGAVAASSALLPAQACFASELPAIVTVGRPILDVLVNTLSLLMLARLILSWYPKTDLKAFPYVLVTWPTEPLLEPARKIIPPAFGVDVSAIVYVLVLSFIREVFTGQQGILTLMEKYGDTLS